MWFFSSKKKRQQNEEASTTQTNAADDATLLEALTTKPGDTLGDLKKKNFLLQTKFDELFFQNLKLSEKVKFQEKRIEILQDQKSWDKKIDEFIDTWYEQNKDIVDLGQVHFRFLGDFDIVPDDLEKHLYKKFCKIAFSFITQFDEHI